MYCYKCGKQNNDQAKFCNDCGTAINQEPSPLKREVISKTVDKENVIVFTDPTKLMYAGFWVRIKAYILDCLGMGAVGFILIKLLEYIGTYWNYSISIVLNVLLSVGFFLFLCLCESSNYQATPGKRAVGIKVTDITGNRITFGRAMGRNIGKSLTSILAIGYIITAFTPKKQSLHDLMASCFVVRDGRIPQVTHSERQVKSGNGNIKD